MGSALKYVITLRSRDKCLTQGKVVEIVGSN
jgi:hypothetical protein